MTVTFEPIGTVRSPYTDWAPEQPLARQAQPGRFAVVLEDRFAGWLEGLSSFRYVILLTYLDRASEAAAPRVKPPWAGGQEVGLFASRAPSRPNRLGTSVARLLGVEGSTLHVGPLDLFDGTPVLDIKPYIKTFDAKDDANDGWIESLDGHRHLLDHLLGAPHDHGHHDHDHHDHDHHDHDHHDHDHHDHRHDD